MLYASSRVTVTVRKRGKEVTITARTGLAARSQGGDGVKDVCIESLCLGLAREKWIPIDQRVYVCL